MGAAAFFAALFGEKLSEAIQQKALDLLFDPAFYEGLSPAAGLAVTPLLFSSIEQEGRWKIQDWGFDSFSQQQEARTLSNPILKAAHDNNVDPIPNPGEAILSHRVGISAKPATEEGSGKLLTIQVPKPPESYDYFSAALGSSTLGLGSVALQLAKKTILQEGNAQIGAEWRHDNVEIWGGFAGLTAAKGFSSVFGHRANVQLSGTVYGNYLPACYLIGMSGYVNPVGPKFVEFRCGAVIRAGKTIKALYGEQWDRDTGKTTDLVFSDKTGFNLSVNPY